MSISTPIFNKFDSMPKIPYKIIEHLMSSTNESSENIWKLLYYNTSDALSQPNLTFDQKKSIIWKGKEPQNNFNIYLTYLVENMQLETKSILKVYKVDGNPINRNISTVCYEIDILIGGKIAIVDWDNVPCNRAELIETMLLQTLNGVDVNGAGFFQYNNELSGLCGSRFNIGNNSTFTGISLVFAVQVANNYDTEC